MPTIRDKRELAIGGTASVLAGSQYEFLPWPAVLRFAVLAADDDVFYTVFTGSNVIQEESEADERALTDPINSEDFLLEDVAGAGEKIGVRITNRNAAAVTVRTVVKIEPLA